MARCLSGPERFPGQGWDPQKRRLLSNEIGGRGQKMCAWERHTVKRVFFFFFFLRSNRFSLKIKKGTLFLMPSAFRAGFLCEPLCLNSGISDGRKSI